MTPLMVVLSSTRWAWGTSLLGSFSITSAQSPTTKARGLLMPHLLTRRTSWMPMGVSGAMVILNFGFGGGAGLGAGFLGSGGGGGGGATGSALIPGWLKSKPCGSSISVPVTLASNVLPTCPPLGRTTYNRGVGKPGPSGFCALASGPHKTMPNPMIRANPFALALRLCAQPRLNDRSGSGSTNRSGPRMPFAGASGLHCWFLYGDEFRAEAQRSRRQAKGKELGQGT